MNSKHQGFTLIELSIVLVIIGLIIGGVLVGRDLVAAAEIRKEVSLLQQYETAFNTFKLKYNCIPGDCNKVGLLPTTFMLAGTSHSTVLGNGDELITAGNVGPAPHRNENLLVWEHLSVTGLIAGMYGYLIYLTGATFEHCDPDGASASCPATAFNNGTVHIMWGAANAGLTGWTTGTSTENSQIGNTLIYNASLSATDDNTAIIISNGSDMGNYGYLGSNTPPQLLSVNQIYNIDAKMDDGQPATGRVLGTSVEAVNLYGNGGGGNSCTDDDVNLDNFINNGGSDPSLAVVNYVMNDPDNDCSLMYIMH